MDVNHIDALKKLYKACFGNFPSNVTPIAESGSNRKYFRLTHSTQSVIGAFNPDIDENRAFVYLSQLFTAKQLPVPELLAISNCENYYLVSDLGNQSLFDEIIKTNWSNTDTESVKLLIDKTINSLVDFQVDGTKGLDYKMCYPQQEFDRQTIMWDLNYFKYCFLKPSGVVFHEVKLEDDFNALADYLLTAPSDFFMYRDFQSRNVMVVDNSPFFIDYQGGRKGPCLYDIASFLYQARAGFPQILRNTLFDNYLSCISAKAKVNTIQLREQFPAFVLFRIIQTLGAYGYRGFFERKNHFLVSIPLAVANISEVLEGIKLKLPYLTEILKSIVTMYTETPQKEASFEGLTIQITSFSFKKGYPVEHPEHGGGFVFDCRGLPNPGRYPEYSANTGMDKVVANYLGKHREVEKFFDGTLSLIRETVEVYKTRKFHHLSISFGCTGGQHRSVYMASRMAELLDKIDGVKINVIHRELK
jgi:aminoglycoside/choline kinase family phosphotransferase